MNRNPLVFAALLALSLTTHAQDTLPKTYDVSTVKPANQAENHGMMLNWGDAELHAENITLAWILTNALHAREDQISGVPGWAKEKHFDITAKLVDVDKEAVKHMTPQKNRELLLALLVERFGLKYHVETKVMPTYNLVPAKSGLHLTPPSDNDKSKAFEGVCRGCSYRGAGSVKARDIDMAHFAEVLGDQLGRDVSDNTGFTGKFDINLRWMPDLGKTVPDMDPATMPDSGSDLPPLPKALQDEMGIHLVSTKGPVKLYIIDHLDQPSAN